MSDLSMMPNPSRGIPFGRALMGGAALLAFGVAIGMFTGQGSAPSAAATLLNSGDTAPPLPQIMRPDPDRSALQERPNPLQSGGPLNRTDPLQRTGPVASDIAWNAPGIQPGEVAGLVRDWVATPDGWQAANTYVASALKSGTATPTTLAQLVSAVTAVTPAAAAAAPLSNAAPSSMVLPPPVYESTQKASPN